MATDILMKEDNNGGDLVLEGNTLKLANSFQNMPYLAMFGGNPEQSTIGQKEEGEQAFDWWGNWLLMSQQPDVQFNSIFERTITQISLSSAGRLQLERSAKEDIKFMEAFALVEISVSIETVDRVKTFIELQEPDNLESTEFVYIWDNAEQELTTE